MPARMFSFRTLTPDPTPGRHLQVNGGGGGGPQVSVEIFGCQRFWIAGLWRAPWRFVGMWACLLAALLGFAGSCVSRNRWRHGVCWRGPGASLACAMPRRWLSPATMGYGWYAPRCRAGGRRPTHLAFARKPESEVLGHRTFGPNRSIAGPINFDADGASVTPPAPAGADTYFLRPTLFILDREPARDQTVAASSPRPAISRCAPSCIGVRQRVIIWCAA